MSRREENAGILDGIVKMQVLAETQTHQERTIFQLATIAAVLCDISKSLAIIADNIERKDKQEDER